MTNAEWKREEAEKHNAEYLKSKQPKVVKQKTRARKRKATQVMAMMLAAKGFAQPGEHGV